MTTFIDTTKCARIKLADAQGEEAEIVNRALCGAENVVAKLRWLEAGDDLAIAPLGETHQLVYLIEGEGVIQLDGKDYAIANGAGLYLGPEESARLRQAGTSAAKFLHLVVPVVA